MTGGSDPSSGGLFPRKKALATEGWTTKHRHQEGAWPWELVLPPPENVSSPPPSAGFTPGSSPSWTPHSGAPGHWNLMYGITSLLDSGNSSDGCLIRTKQKMVWLYHPTYGLPKNLYKPMSLNLPYVSRNICRGKEIWILIVSITCQILYIAYFIYFS